MVNISTTVRGHYGNDVYLWAIIIRRFFDTLGDGSKWEELSVDLHGNEHGSNGGGDVQAQIQA
jgi:hypothetical protein